jgi:hypothetical protein
MSEEIYYSESGNTFVDSGEYRFPRWGEWFLTQDGRAVKSKINHEIFEGRKNLPSRVILHEYISKQQVSAMILQLT